MGVIFQVAFESVDIDWTGSNSTNLNPASEPE